MPDYIPRRNYPKSFWNTTDGAIVATIIIIILFIPFCVGSADAGTLDGTRASASYYSWAGAPVANYAAHKSLALGTHVRLCRHSRCTTVIIEDRCPGCGPHGFDLAPASFRRLAPLAQGVLRGRVLRTWR